MPIDLSYFACAGSREEYLTVNFNFLVSKRAFLSCFMKTVFTCGSYIIFLSLFPISSNLQMTERDWSVGLRSRHFRTCISLHKVCGRTDFIQANLGLVMAYFIKQLLVSRFFYRSLMLATASKFVRKANEKAFEFCKWRQI